MHRSSCLGARLKAGPTILEVAGLPEPKIVNGTPQPGFPICRFLNDNHAAVGRIQQASGGPGRAARLPTAAF
jgi:hypothetical protein